MLPMPSKLASPSKKAELYKQSSVGIEDDSLFSIKSVFDQDAKVCRCGCVCVRLCVCVRACAYERLCVYAWVGGGWVGEYRDG